MTKVTLKDIKEMQSEIDASLTITKALREEMTSWNKNHDTEYWKIYNAWKRKYDDSWRKDSRLSAKLRKLQRKYWEEHGIQD